MGEDTAMSHRSRSFHRRVLFEPLERRTLLTGTFTDMGSLGLPGLDRAIAWGDYDNDGRLDILSGSGLFHQDGNGQFSLNAAAGLPVMNVWSDAAWGDYDNDGRLDVLIAGLNQTEEPHRQGLSQRRQRSFHGQPWSPAHRFIGSFRGVGRLRQRWPAGHPHRRILGQSSQGYKLILAHQGLPQRRERAVQRECAVNRNTVGIEFGSATWVDLNNDGRLDFLVTGRDSDWNPVTEAYQNLGDGTFWNVYWYSGCLISLINGDAAWGDFNNDGWLDVVLMGSEDAWDGPTQTWVQGNTSRSGLVSFNVAAYLTGAELGSVAWGDYDNDGWPDVLVTGHEDSGSGATRVYHNNNGTGFNDIAAGLAGLAGPCAAWGDYDSDGRLDILLTGTDAYGNRVTKIYHNETPAANTVPAAYWTHRKRHLQHHGHVVLGGACRRSNTGQRLELQPARRHHAGWQ